MSEPLWTFDRLAWYARSEDPEVRYWAAERLIRCFPERAPAAVALLVLDDHDTTPELVAENLRDHGGLEHVPILLRAFRQLRGMAPARAFEALARIGYPEAPDLARKAAERADLSESVLAVIIEAASRIGTDDARSAVRGIIERREDLLNEPGALRGALESCPSGELPGLFVAFTRALQWKGLGRSADLLRVVTDHVEADDCAWCVRTGPDGRIDLRKTIKAVEAGYDCDLEGQSPALSPEGMRSLALSFRSNDLASAAVALHEAIETALAALREDPADPLPGRIAAVAAALVSPPVRAEAERLGAVFQHGVVAVLMSLLFKVARYRNYARAVERAGSDIPTLLVLAEDETAFLLGALPGALRRAIEQSGPERGPAQREAVLGWCRRMLDARGPFFPKAIALETIGELRAEDHVPELLEALSDENSYIFGAAEAALSKIGGALVGPARAHLQAGTLDHEAMHSLLMLLVERGDRSCLSLILDHFDEFVEMIGPGETAEWAALLGARELYDVLHPLLPRDVARVGQALLLLGAIHNIQVPEEAQIHQAIEDYWRRHPAGEGAGGDDENGPGSYVM